MTVRVRKNIVRVRQALQGQSVRVGFPQETTGTRDYETGINVATNALIQTLGNPDNRMFGGPVAPIPARDFMGQAVADWRRAWLRRGATRAFLRATRSGRPEAFADAIGLSLQGFMQESITANSWPANSQFTIASKGSSQPLIDSGLMRQSVDYVVN